MDHYLRATLQTAESQELKILMQDNLDPKS